MSILSLERASTHLRIDSTDDEEYVQQLIDVAEESISTYLNRPLAPWSDTQSSPPLAVQQACLLMLGSLYQFREADVEKVLSANPAVDRLLCFHRLGLGF